MFFLIRLERRTWRRKTAPYIRQRFAFAVQKQFGTIEIIIRLRRHIDDNKNRIRSVERVTWCGNLVNTAESKLCTFNRFCDKSADFLILQEQDTTFFRFGYRIPIRTPSLYIVHRTFNSKQRSVIVEDANSSVSRENHFYIYVAVFDDRVERVMTKK